MQARDFSSAQAGVISFTDPQSFLVGNFYLCMMINASALYAEKNRISLTQIHTRYTNIHVYKGT